VHDKGKRFNTDLLEVVALGFLLELAEILVQGTLARKESRGNRVHTLSVTDGVPTCE
jgi:succinate dehydrogenase / fumarate reductase flavoprotein subunit